MSEKFECPYYGELTLDEGIKEITITEIYFTIVFEDELNIEELTNILEIKPSLDKSWKIGDEIRGAKGKYYKYSRWSMPSIFTEDLLVEEKVLEYIKPLQKKIDLLQKLKQNHDLSYVIEIVPRIDNHQSVPALTLSKELIDFCYKTGIEIDIDIYL